MARQPQALDPGARATLRDVLLPPDGYRLDHALGTAYSLDAETLVTIPLFAAGLGAEELERPVGIARIFELGTRLTLLVQGDRITISKRWAGSRALLRLLGDAVVPCSIKDGSFHPKLLVLEFASLNPPGLRLHRVIVATRNLTTDNSWDSIVVLDEADDGLTVPGLAETVGGLAQFVNDTAHPATAQCSRVAEALAGVKFQQLRGLSDLEVRLFNPGSPNAERLRAKIQGDELLIISPFVRRGFLDSLAGQVGVEKANRWLVTRPVAIPDSAFANYQVFQISDAVVPDHVSPGTENAPADEADRGSDQMHRRLAGLHAKIYIASSRNHGTRIVVTSANATRAGWTNNVEVAFTGVSHMKALQVQNVVAPRQDSDYDRTFGDLLDEITPDAVEVDEVDIEWVTQVRRVLARAVGAGVVVNGPPRQLEITVGFPADGLPWPADVEISVYPFGYLHHRATLALGPGLLRGRLAIEPGIELTPFVVVVVTKDGDPPLELVLSIKLAGDLDWGREEARKSLAQAAKPRLLQELLWYFGVRGNGVRSATSGTTGRRSEFESTPLLPILEKVLLRVHSPDGATEVETIDSLLAGVEGDPDFAELAKTWQLVKGSLK